MISSCDSRRRFTGGREGGREEDGYGVYGCGEGEARGEFHGQAAGRVLAGAVPR